jgi:uncharacterized protein (DUF58 family)
MPRLLRRVTSTLSIRAHRRVFGLLDGEYASVFQGRSLDFDDLRPYVPGDEIKDVDWKATARLGSLMTRRFVAQRKHTVVLVVDTGRGMAATAPSGEMKRDVAILAAGTAGFIAQRHGDLVALVAGDANGSTYVRPASTEAHLERMLQRIYADTRLDAGPSDLSAQLSYVASAFGRGRILVVVADDRELSEREQVLLRRLVLRHEVLWFTVADADLMDPELASVGMRDVDAVAALPAFVRRSRVLRDEFAEAVRARAGHTKDVLDSLAISSQRVTSSDEVVPRFLRLLELHKHARR